MNRPGMSFQEMLNIFTESQKSATRQPLLQRCVELLDTCLCKIYRNQNWLEEFSRVDTDFERVCYLLRHLQTIEQAKESIRTSTVASIRNKLKRNNGKSDNVSELLRLQSRIHFENEEWRKALRFSTLALFYALSAKQMAISFGQRSIILYTLGLLDEAIQDANEALKVPQSKADLAKLLTCLGHCHLHKGSIAKAVKNFERALEINEINGKAEYECLRECASKGLDECRKFDESKPTGVSKSLWRHFSPNTPKFSLNEKLTNPKGQRPLTATDGSLRLKYTGPELGWTLETTRDVEAGEFLIIERAYAISFRRRRTKYCYNCFRRRLNLIPCAGCPHFGFCSKSCAEISVKECKVTPKRINRHLYDCRGLLPCILINQSAFLKDPCSKVTDLSILAQSAFMCIANTDPQILLDYICSTGDYKGGTGHQAFLGATIRAIPPTLFDPSDYSSIAWLPENTDTLTPETKWNNTVVAVYLTYCLYIAGYPVDWEYADMLGKLPSPTNRPKCIPASWLAACILFHWQSTNITSFEISDKIGLQRRSKKFKCAELGKAIYPTIALVNNSCDPSAMVVFGNGGEASLVTLKRLSAGSEISIKYFAKYYEETKENRQKLLKDIFRFDCKCEACIKGWCKSSLDLNEIVVCPLCSAEFNSFQIDCSFCSSRSWLKSYQETIQDLHKLERDVNNGSVNLKLIESASSLIRRAVTRIVPPSQTLRRLEESFECLISFKYNAWTEEPWCKQDDFGFFINC